MALRLRRGTNADRLNITPAEGELIYTTDTKKIYAGDGSTPGGNIVSGINNLVEDITPQLGGTLDLNTHNIVGNGNITVDNGEISASSFKGDLIGSIFANSSDILVDAIQGKLVLNNNTLNDLQDVSITGTPQDITTYVLTFNGTNWIAAPPPSNGGGGGNVNANTQDVTISPQALIYNPVTLSYGWSNLTDEPILFNDIRFNNAQGAFYGSVYAENSAILVDGIAGKLVLDQNLLGDIGNVNFPSPNQNQDIIIWNNSNATWTTFRDSGESLLTLPDHSGRHYGSVYGANNSILIDHDQSKIVLATNNLDELQNVNMPTYLNRYDLLMYDLFDNTWKPSANVNTTFFDFNKVFVVPEIEGDVRGSLIGNNSSKAFDYWTNQFDLQFNSVFDLGDVELEVTFNDNDLLQYYDGKIKAFTPSNLGSLFELHNVSDVFGDKFLLTTGDLLTYQSGINPGEGGWYPAKIEDILGPTPLIDIKGSVFADDSTILLDAITRELQVTNVEADTLIANTGIVGDHYTTDTTKKIIDSTTGWLFTEKLQTGLVETTFLRLKKDSVSDGLVLSMEADGPNNIPIIQLSRDSAVTDFTGSALGQIYFQINDSINGFSIPNIITGFQNRLQFTVDPSGTYGPTKSVSIGPLNANGQIQVGIGTTSPTANLDVVGSVTASGSMQVGRYADDAARDTAITLPAEGMMVFNQATQKFQGYVSDTGLAGGGASNSTAGWIDLH